MGLVNGSLVFFLVASSAASQVALEVGWTGVVKLGRTPSVRSGQAVHPADRLRRTSKLVLAWATLTGATAVGLTAPAGALEPDHDTTGGSSYEPEQPVESEPEDPDSHGNTMSRERVLANGGSDRQVANASKSASAPEAASTPEPNSDNKQDLASVYTYGGPTQPAPQSSQSPHLTQPDPDPPANKPTTSEQTATSTPEAREFGQVDGYNKDNDPSELEGQIAGYDQDNPPDPFDEQIAEYNKDNHPERGWQIVGYENDNHPERGWQIVGYDKDNLPADFKGQIAGYSSDSSLAEPGRAETDIRYDMFGNRYDSDAEARVADSALGVQAWRSNFELGLEPAEDWHVEPIEGVSPGVYRNPSGAAIVGSPDSDELKIAQQPMGGYRATINGTSHLLDPTELGGLVVFGDGWNDVMKGSDLPEIFVGSAGHDRISPGGGSDFVVGGAGDDWIVEEVTSDRSSNLFIGGDGHDYIRSGAGDDRVFGGPGNDWAFAGDGADFVDAGSGNDLVYGEGDADFLLGGTGKDYIDAGSGNDFVEGEEGNDTVIGGKDDDVIHPGIGADTAVAGPGNDVIVETDADEIDADVIDTVYAEVTDDLVGYNEKDRQFFVEAVEPEPEDSAIRFDLDPALAELYDSDMTTLRSIPAGKAMLESIESSDHTVTVGELNPRYARSGRGLATARRSFPEIFGFARKGGLQPDGQPGVTTDAVIGFNPLHGQPGSFKIPIATLAHEFVHADDFVHGTMPLGKSVEVDENGDFLAGTYGLPVTTKNGELRALGLPYNQDATYGEITLNPDRLEVHPSPYSENIVREQLGLPRGDHYSMNWFSYSLKKLIFGQDSIGISSEDHRTAEYDAAQETLNEHFATTAQQLPDQERSQAVEQFAAAKVADRAAFIEASTRLTAIFDELDNTRQITDDNVSDLSQYHDREIEALATSGLQGRELWESLRQLEAQHKSDLTVLSLVNGQVADVFDSLFPAEAEYMNEMKK